MPSTPAKTVIEPSRSARRRTWRTQEGAGSGTIHAALPNRTSCPSTVANAGPLVPHREVTGTDPFMMIFTSGTSGEPKAVQVPHIFPIFAGANLVDRFAATGRLSQVGAGKMQAQLTKARKAGGFVELLGEKPEDDREAVASAGNPEPEVPPAGAHGKQGAAKIATKQRAEQKK